MLKISKKSHCLVLKTKNKASAFYLQTKRPSRT